MNHYLLFHSFFNTYHKAASIHEQQFAHMIRQPSIDVARVKTPRKLSIV